MKAYTDLKQSKKLAEFLPIESADMLYYCNKSNNTLISQYPFTRSFKETDTFSYLHCWSLSALFSLLPSASLDSSDDHHFRLHCMEKFTEWHDNAIDACVEMIEKLHKQMIYDFNNSCERARGELGSGCYNKGTIEYIFPELKESDGERIRKALIEVFSNREKYLIDQSFGDITVSEALTWLEKQGEKEIY